MSEALGFVGVGRMGSRMAARLMDAGHRLTVYDIREEAMAPLVGRGAGRASSSREVADASDIVFFSLPEPRDVQGEAIGAKGVIEGKRAKILVDLSTTGPRIIGVVAESLARVGIVVVDAPVSGGVAGAAAATLTFMVGGPAEGFARAEPVLKSIGKAVIHAGAAGAGQAAKICNNMMLAINMVGVSEGFLLARKLGLDWDKLFQIASTSSGQSWALSSYCPAPGPVPAAPSNREYAAGFTAALMLKDVKLSQAAADAAGSPTPLGAHAMSFYQAVVDAGDGGKDFSVVFRWLEKLSRAKK
jgi:3-hydroxyisobutyrate dehydrogenase